MEELNQSIGNNYREERLLKKIRNHKFKRDNKNNNKIKKIYFLSIITICVIILLLFFFKKIFYTLKQTFDNILKKYYNDTYFKKYKIMLPHLTPDLKEISPTIEEVFNARQIYISDVRITPDYIKYLRPINETEELKYKKRYSDNETIVDKKLFEKRTDQYNYTDFCKIALEEKLIDNNTIEYGNKPIISVILPTDNSSKIFNYLLETDPRIRIFHHLKNMGLFRSRLDGILYSRGKYILAFDPGDLYEDNYVLTDVYNVIEKYNLDSCKFLFRVIRSFNNLQYSYVNFHINYNEKIVYGSYNIKALNTKIFRYWGQIWNRLVRANIYIKCLLLLNELTLNIYKNLYEDVVYNEIIHKISYSYAVIDRIGYVYLIDGKGLGSPGAMTLKPRNYYLAREYVAFLSFDYNFCEDIKCKNYIVKKLRDYNEINYRIQLKNFRNHFEVLNNLLEVLIKDPDISKDNKKYCEKLLNESLIREKEVNQTI